MRSAKRIPPFAIKDDEVFGSHRVATLCALQVLRPQRWAFTLRSPTVNQDTRRARAREDMSFRQQRDSQNRIRRLALLCTGVAALVVAAHWPVLSARALSFDDGQYLAENELVQHPGFESARRFLTEVLEPSTVRGYYQPLAMISLMLDYAAGGRPDNLLPFHITSLALHIANTVLVIVVFHLLFGQAWPAALVGLLYGLHPVAVEPIAWISDRKTLLATMFSLVSMSLYVRCVSDGRWRLYVACLVAYILALMSKPTAAPLPLLFLLLDAWPLRRLNRRAVLEKVPLVAVGLVFAALTVVSQQRTASVTLPAARSLGELLLTSTYNAAFYFRKLFWPTGMSGYYMLPEPLALSNPVVLGGCLGSVLLCACVLVCLRWSRALLVGWLFYLIAVSPTLGVIGFTNVSAADKFAYLPLVGLLVPVGAALSAGWVAGRKPRRSRLAAFVALMLVAVLAMGEALATRRTLGHWRDSETLFRYMLAHAPRAWQPHNSLANDLVKQGRLDEAFEHYAEALRLRPDYFEGHGSLAAVLLNLERFEEAERHYRAALAQRPDSAKVHAGLAGALAGQRRYEESVAHFQKALRLDPDSASTHYNFARVLAECGRRAAAIEHYQEAVRLAPNHYKGHYNLAQLLIAQGRAVEAVAHLEQALRIQPELQEAHLGLGEIALAQARTADAVAHFRAALRLAPGQTAVMSKLAWLLATNPDPQERDAAEAIELAERVCESTGYADPAYLDTLAAAYAASGRFDAAIKALRRAIELAEVQAPGLVVELKQRLSLYDAGRPYHELSDRSP